MERSGEIKKTVDADCYFRLDKLKAVLGKAHAMDSAMQANKEIPFIVVSGLKP